MSSFATYIIGFIILIIGLAAGAYLLNVPTPWILVGVVVFLGIGVLMATSRTKTRDASLHATHYPPHPAHPPYPPQQPPVGSPYPPASQPPSPPGGANPPRGGNYPGGYGQGGPTG